MKIDSGGTDFEQIYFFCFFFPPFASAGRYSNSFQGQAASNEKGKKEGNMRAKINEW